MKNIVAVILAAGKSTRMNTSISKVLHKVCGKRMIDYLVDSIHAIGIRRVIVVTGFKGSLVEKHLNGRFETVRQEQALGTGHAVLQTWPRLKGHTGDILVLYADTPLLTSPTIGSLIREHHQRRAAVSMLTVFLKDPSGYGRIARDREGRVQAIVEETDATARERKINEINAGVYVFRAPDLFATLRRLQPTNRKQEYYLTDCVAAFAKQKKPIATFSIDDPQEVIGINSRTDLAEAQRVMKQRILEHHMHQGVTILDPLTTYIDADVTIGRDTVIYPFTLIESNVSIGEGCQLGPFCRLRSGTALADSCAIGNFCEISRSRIGTATSIKHHSFLGDCQIGKNVNIGAGTITANFDGRQIRQTIIQDRCLIGSNTTFIAPVEVGPGAVTGAGAVITRGTKIPARATVVGMPARVLARNGRTPSAARTR